MEITWITPRHPPQKGGMAQSSGRIVNSLLDRGHAVQVIRLQALPDSLPATDATQAENLAEFFWTRSKQITGQVVTAFGGGTEGYAATLWAKWLGIKSMVMFRGNDFEKGVHDPRKGWMTHFILNEADAVCAVSQEMARRAGSLRKNGEVFYTPNGIDLADWMYLDSDRINCARWKKENVPEGKAVVGVFGQLKRKKGLELAISLFTKGGFGEKAVLMTVGDVPEEDLGRLKSECSHFWRGVEFQRRESLPAFYMAADAVLIPSIYDGAPNVLLEAMALGKVVAASRAGGIPDMARDGENGFLFDPQDATGAALALDKALGYRGATLTIGLNAQRTIQESFTRENEVDSIERALFSTAGA